MRKSDKNQKAIRHYRSSERFFRQDGQWFFQTREGARGPFKTREAAKQELGRFVDTMEFLEESEKHMPSDTDWKNVTVADPDTLPGDIRRRRNLS
ncbi:MAG: DUF6316 family protein [Pseudomonadales bacterium]